MLISLYPARSFSVYLRDQGHLFRPKHKLLRCTAIKQSHGQSRYLGHGPKLAESEVQRDSDELDHCPLRPKLHRDTSTPQYQLPRGHHYKKIFIHTKDDLGIESLGQPAEALVLPAAEKQLETRFNSTKSEKIDPTGRPSSVDEILHRIQAEKEIVSARGVAKNLEDLRDTWAVSRYLRNRSPPAKECEDFVEKIYHGFSKGQLYGYYSEGYLPVPDPSNIELPYSTKAYTRSSWTAGSTPFPGDAHLRLRSARLSAGALVPAKSPTFLTPNELIHFPKRVLVEKILWERWGIRSRQDEESLGELEIWLQYEHLCLLMSHSQCIYLCSQTVVNLS